MRSIKTFARVRVLAIATSFAGLLLGTGTAESSDYLSRSEVQTFIESMSAEHGLDPAEIERVLGDARYQPTVVRLIGPAPTSPSQGPRSYPAYRKKFLTKHRIAAGVRYWDLHERDLRRAQAQYGVPAEVILGILGVETAFGRNTGSFRVVDVLATIAFDGPRRQDYFRDELKELLLLAHERGMDPLSLKGSYAGAVGLPQFMPSSYRKLAVDFDEDGVIDLNGSPADAIGSVASYLQSYGWTPNETPRVIVRLPAGKQSELVSGLDRVYEVPELKEQGVKFTSSRLPKGLCSVVELPTPGKPSKYVAGFGNFEAITRYNRSTFYATAVLDLADAIHSARRHQIAARAEANASATEQM
ncbi:MAG TPA: lytic murein transglycosylase B [Steroidobacteraceae bacterium]|nr:lytic murein transglycosylase B [Steroidobacteraceae bacterium]